MPVTRTLLRNFLEKVFDNLFFFGLGRSVHPLRTVFQFVTFVNQQRGVATVIHNELRARAIRPSERLHRAFPILFEGLTLPGEDRETSLRNRGSGMILRRENIARSPANIGTQGSQRLNQDRGLNGHVQRTRDAHAL